MLDRFGCCWVNQRQFGRLADRFLTLSLPHICWVTHKFPQIPIEPPFPNDVKVFSSNAAMAKRWIYRMVVLPFAIIVTNRRRRRLLKAAAVIDVVPSPPSSWVLMQSTAAGQRHIMSLRMEYYFSLVGRYTSILRHHTICHSLSVGGLNSFLSSPFAISLRNDKQPMYSIHVSRCV